MKPHYKDEMKHAQNDKDFRERTYSITDLDESTRIKLCLFECIAPSLSVTEQDGKKLLCIKLKDKEPVGVVIDNVLYGLFKRVL